jgi:hypothetical protein
LADSPYNVQDILADIEAAGLANPYWLMGVHAAAKVMIPRRQKYSGEYHPFFNFACMYYLMQEKNIGITMDDVWSFYINLKEARMLATRTNFADESLLDTQVDCANYRLFPVGWALGGLKPEIVLPRAQWLTIRGNQATLQIVLDDLADELGYVLVLKEDVLHFPALGLSGGDDQ